MAGERSNNDNLNAANNDAEKEGDRERIERKRIKNAKNHYEVLGVLKDASDDEITTAFRSLSKKYFPDRNPGDDEAPALFKKVKKAARVLLDPQKRADYDLLQEKKGEVLGKKNLSGNIKITSELKPDTSDWSLEKLQAELSRKEFALDMAREKRESSPENIEKLENEAIELRQRIAKVQGGSGLVSPPPATEPQKRKQVADPVPQPDALTNPVLTLEEQAMDAQISGLKEANREQVQVLEGLENLENENAAGKKAQAEPETEKRGPKIPEMKNLWEALGRMESEVQRQTELARVLKAFKKGERVYGSLKDKMEYYLKLDEITKNKKGNVDKFSELKFKVYRKNGEEIAGKIITKKITEIEYREWKKTKKAPADGDTYVTSEGKPVELEVQEVKENSFLLKDAKENKDIGERDLEQLRSYEGAYKDAIEPRPKKPGRKGASPKPRPSAGPDIEVVEDPATEVDPGEKPEGKQEMSLEEYNKLVAKKTLEKLAERAREKRRLAEVAKAEREAAKAYETKAPKSELEEQKETVIFHGPHKAPAKNLVKANEKGFPIFGEEAEEETEEVFNMIGKALPLSLVWHWTGGKLLAKMSRSPIKARLRNKAKIAELKEDVKEFWRDADKEIVDWWQENAWKWLRADEKPEVEAQENAGVAPAKKPELGFPKKNPFEMDLEPYTLLEVEEGKEYYVQCPTCESDLVIIKDRTETDKNAVIVSKKVMGSRSAKSFIENGKVECLVCKDRFIPENVEVKEEFKLSLEPEVSAPELESSESDDLTFSDEELAELESKELEEEQKEEKEINYIVEKINGTNKFEELVEFINRKKEYTRTDGKKTPATKIIDNMQLCKNDIDEAIKNETPPAEIIDEVIRHGTALFGEIPRRAGLRAALMDFFERYIKENSSGAAPVALESAVEKKEERNVEASKELKEEIKGAKSFKELYKILVEGGSSDDAETLKVNMDKIRDSLYWQIRDRNIYIVSNLFMVGNKEFKDKNVDNAFRNLLGELNKKINKEFEKNQYTFRAEDKEGYSYKVSTLGKEGGERIKKDENFWKEIQKIADDFM